MSSWKIVVPEATTNYITNPSFESNVTDGWTKVSGTDAARDTSLRMFGLASMKLTAAGAGTDTVYKSNQYSLANGATVYVSVYVYRASTTPTGNVIIYDATGSAARATTAIATTAGYWQRVEATWTNSTGSAANVELRLSNTKRDSAALLYFDGCQMEVKSYATTYCDGDQEGCSWSTTAHNSSSSRAGTSRIGGRERDLATDLGITVGEVPGIGMPPTKHNSQQQALLPGAYYQGRTVLPRDMTLMLYANGGNAAANLHGLRKDLIDVVKPDADPDDEAFLVRYSGANSSKLPAEVKARYGSGLEFTNTRSPVEIIPLRLMCYDPFWREQGNDAKEIITGSTATLDLAYIAKLDIASGVWSACGTGMNGQVDALTVGYTGYWLYTGGNFTTAGGVAANYAARYDIGAGTWSAMGTGMNGRVRAVVQTADNYVYMGGDFTTSGGTTTNYVARWNGTAWNALGGATKGTNGAVHSIDSSSYHYLLVSGAFTQAGGSTANRIAKWSGSAWSTFGSGVSSGTVYAVKTSQWNQSVFHIGFSASPYLRTWDNGSSSFYDAVGLNGAVRSLAVKSGSYQPWLFGDFTAPYTRAAKGDFYLSGLGSGLSAGGYSAATHPTTGDIYVGGAFTTAGGVSAPYMAKWNGSTWTGLGITLPGTPTVGAMAIDPSGKTLYVGFNTTGTVAAGSFPGSTTVTNLGTATTYPKIKIKRVGGTSATIRSITNATQGTTIYSNYSMQDGETITINLQDKTVVTDYTGGSVIGSVVARNSDFGKWGLLPGTNDLTCLVETAGSPTVTAWLEWQTQHWSADGAAA